jgi:hypothetical protein
MWLIIVTVNDYLAARDAQWMNKIFDFLDLSVGVITSDMLPENKNIPDNLSDQTDYYVTRSGRISKPPDKLN